ncbi:MAG: COX15/CtaA family protein [Ornithinimicrobium sp.]
MPLPPMSRLLPGLLKLNLGVQILIVVTGGLVRLTGSGLGCPEWPTCDSGSVTPIFRPEDGIHPYVEFGNRLVGVVVGLVAVALLLAVWRGAVGRARGRMLALAALILAGTLAQAVLGGISVITELNPATVMAHFIISAVLISVSTLLLLTYLQTGGRASASETHLPPPLPGVVQVLAVVTAFVGSVVIVLGTIVTGSGPHSGDADQPARFGFDPRTVAWLHADSVMLFVGLVVAMVVVTSVLPPAMTTRRPDIRRPWRLVLTVSLAQGVLGYLQYATGVPVPLVSLHMLGACLLVTTLTWGVYSVLVLNASAAVAASLGQREIEQRIDGDAQEDQREITDGVVKEPHRT